MAWDVEFTDEFERWWMGLDEPIQDAIDGEHLKQLDREERAQRNTEEK